MEDLLRKKKSLLFHHSPYRFIGKLSKEYIVEETIIKPLLNEIDNKTLQVVEVIINKQSYFFILKKLDWDSNYFGFENFKIINVIYDQNDFTDLVKAVFKFKCDFCNVLNAYYFIDLPSEDVLLQQAFNLNGFRLVESRLNYYYENIKNYTSEEKFETRLANFNDAEHLKAIAIKMRNSYDRFHADAFINQDVADSYLGEFAFNSVKGYADYVLVPNVDVNNPFGFLAFNKPIDIAEFKVSKLVLAAIDNSVEKGWLYKLLNESLSILKSQNTDYLTTVTQTSNVPAFKTWEKFGFKLGFVTNILVLKN